MNASNLLTKLRRAHFDVAANREALIMRPRDLLADALRAEIRAHKRTFWPSFHAVAGAFLAALARLRKSAASQR